jgi:hypothetical protein
MDLILYVLFSFLFFSQAGERPAELPAVVFKTSAVPLKTSAVEISAPQLRALEHCILFCLFSSAMPDCVSDVRVEQGRLVLERGEMFTLFLVPLFEEENPSKFVWVVTQVRQKENKNCFFFFLKFCLYIHVSFFSV